ncbi:MAG: ATP-binding protein [Polyangiales bacterium]
MKPTPTTLVRVLALSHEVAAKVTELAEAAQLPASVHICSGTLDDAVENARGANPEGILAVVEGKNAVVTALAAGVDEAIEAHVLTPELLVLAAKLASERRRSRRERDELQKSLARTAKLAALGTVVAGVAHEINNPATMIGLQLSHLGHMVSGLRTSLLELERTSRDWDGPARADVDRALARMRSSIGDDRAEQAVRDCEVGMRMIGEVVKDLRVLSHGEGESPPEIVDLRKLVEQVVRMSGIEVGDGIHIERDFPDEVPQLWLPRSRVLQIFANLVANSAFAMRASKCAIRRLRVIVRLDETTMMVAFMDTGTGIASDRLGQLFEPFFTTKGPEHGTGLGLYMSREIVRRLGGDLTIDSVEGRGTTAMVFLPLALQTAAAPERREQAKRPRILIAHDEPEQLLALRSALLPYYDLTLAQGAIEALDLVDSGSRIDAILCGRDEPSIDHESLSQRLAAHSPHLARRTVLLEEVSLPGSQPQLDLERLRDAIQRRISPSAEPLDHAPLAR